MRNFSQALPGLSKAFDMVFVEGGTFLMGDEHGDLADNCRPVHMVTIPDYYIGKFPVTQALWKAVINGENPNYFQGDEYPVIQISWNDITQKFLPNLRKITHLSYRLPTEAEWEYAVRGGKYYNEGYNYSGSDRLKDVGWFDNNSDADTKQVGLKCANQLGIYDMSGNVWEWCEDDWHENYNKSPNDGRAWIDSPKRGTDRAIRGGSWGNDAQNCRSAYRGILPSVVRDFNIGFRLALSLQADGNPFPALQ